MIKTRPPYQLGQWLRVKMAGDSTLIGEVTGYGVARDHWTGKVEGETVIVMNCFGGAEVVLADVIETIDPVELFRKLCPGEPLPEYLQRRATK